MNIFEKAVRIKLRVDSNRGLLTVEDLWDLKVEELDGLYRKFKKEARDAEEESLINPVKADEKLNLKIDVLKHVVTVKLTEREAASNRADTARKKAELLELIKSKENSAMAEKSLDELMEMYNAL